MIGRPVNRLLSTVAQSAAIALWAVVLLQTAPALEEQYGDSPRDIAAASQVKGGLVVHVGPGIGAVSTGFRVGPSCVIHAIDSDPRNVARAREEIQSMKLSGQVAVGECDGTTLPYVDGLVNLLIVPHDADVNDDEIARVLAPRGVAMVGANRFTSSPSLIPLSTDLTHFKRLVKVVPSEIDDWTHYLHGPDGHAMSNDTAVAQPWHIQWIGSPKHAKSHKHLTTVNLMVSGGGRLFAIVDESPTALPNSLPSRWAIVARDAFNGIELWRRPIEKWQPYYVADRNSIPADVHRRLVASDDLLFATLGIFAPVSALDTATGKTVRTYGNTDQAEDIIHEDGVLYISVNTGPREKLDRLKMAYRHVEPTQKRVMAFDAQSGDLIWQKEDADTDGLMPLTLASKGARVYYQNPQGVVCLDKKTGVVVWRSDRPSDYFRPGWSSPTLVAFDDVVISADRQSGPDQKIAKDQFAAGGFSTGDIAVFSVESGKRLWDAPCAEGCREPTDVFRREGELWFGKTLQRAVHEYREAHNPLTGDVLRETPLDEDFPQQHHHRCYRDKATSNFILSGRTGVEFINLDTGKVSLHTWIRGNCKFGVLPCNGLLYLPPEQCGCYVESKLTGFHALAPKRPSQLPKADEHPVEKGPAYGKTATRRSTAKRVEASAEAWPTFRHDTARSGRASTTVSPGAKQAWRVELGGRLTQPVVADGKLFVASIDDHTLYILDADTGSILQGLVVGGRIDSPPTIARGLAVFGCRDGWVYALDYASGELAWRTRAAPAASSLVDNERVESVWPVHGSVMIRDDVVFLAAGRSSYVDGGIRMAKLDLLTGKPLLNKTFYSRDPKTGDAIDLYKPFPKGKIKSLEMPGVLPDVLSSDGDRVWMRSVTFDMNLEIQPEFPAHLFSSMGFLDDSWWDLSYWMYGRHMFGGRSGIGVAVGMYPTGRIMVCDDDKAYGYQEEYETLPRAALVASDKYPKKTGLGGKGKYKHVEHDWEQNVPLHAFGLVLAGDTLFMAGPPVIDREKTREILATLGVDDYEPARPLKEALDTFAGANGGLLYAVSKSDGAQVMKSKLTSVPVFDGLIAANSRLYISMTDGSVVCMK